MEQIKIFDTTLRDGEQSPGCSMNLKEKLEIARHLEKMKVDIIEAGFAISSPGDFESVNTIAKNIRECTVASLARALEKDIDAAWEAVKVAADPRIHLFIATSPLHMEYKLKMTPDKVLEKTAAMTAYAKKYCSNIEFSAEDATRSDPDFLCKVVELAIANGANTINLPDTVGYTTPGEMRNLIEYVIKNTPNSDKAIFSVHCHNDLGMAVANSLGGVLGGARQIECTVNGLGERAGNTSLEEAVMAMRTRPDMFSELYTGIDTTQIYRTSKTVYNIIGQSAPLNKPIVGRNAFAHESGIHQHGVLANKKTYEILTPEAVGIHTNSIVLGKHSGKHAFESHIKEMGYTLDEEELLRCFDEFKALCDKKKTVSDEDIEAIILHGATNTNETEGYSLDWFTIYTSNFTSSTSSVSLKFGDEKFENVSLGDGPIDASFKAIDGIINPPEHTFDVYNINSISEGKDTLGVVNVKLTSDNRTYSGVGLSTDIIEASITAYIKAMNKLLAGRKKS
ncbi:MAG: 2-isopropylmalate synthase [Clostridia bacterium]|nr:2-isopropylmalate synthase [Clostridia bacterium]MBR4978928.1 2-isopropylmalate synthase [Clostridia bacterium]